jgi:hypothetical protein
MDRIRKRHEEDEQVTSIKKVKEEEFAEQKNLL